MTEEKKDLSFEEMRAIARGFQAKAKERVAELDQEIAELTKERDAKAEELRAVQEQIKVRTQERIDLATDLPPKADVEPHEKHVLDQMEPSKWYAAAAIKALAGESATSYVAATMFRRKLLQRKRASSGYVYALPSALPV